LPGTKFYEKVKAELKQKSNWTDSDELALMFTNTFPPDFYKRLHRYVHKSYRLSLALKQMGKLLRHPLKAKPVTVRKAMSGLYYAPAAFLDKIRLRRLEVMHE
jgi:anaerobic magnesium-protoporphyrin IX monomethyl ester cyclase